MKETKMTVNEAMDAVKTFIKQFGAGIIAFALLFLANMPVSAEQVLLVAILVAVNQYFKEKGLYSTALKTVGIKKK